jgi:two-component system sensor histidine kinase VanS
MATDAHGRQRPSRPTWPTITIRTRLTLTFTALVAIAGLFTVGIVTVFMRTIPVYVLPDTVATRIPEQAGATSSSAATVTADVAQPTGLTLRTTTDILDTTLVVSLLAVLLVVAVAALSAWIIAGRMLRPLKTINAAAQQAGAGTLDHRIGMVGPRDELRDLADTFDSMLDRLDRSFATTQRFAANASHELRTPLATTQTMLEVALSDPDIGADDLRAVAERVLETNRRGIAIVAALLELAEHDQWDVEFQDLDLVPLIESALDDERSTIEASGIAVTIELPASAPVHGDAVLLRQAVVNVVHNSVRYNRPGGLIRIRGHSDESTMTLAIENTGDDVTEQITGTLTEPFVRGTGRIAGTSDRGYGLGLAIVDSIVRLHQGTLTLQPRAGGGLAVTIDLPRQDRAQPRPASDTVRDETQRVDR